MQGLLVLAVAAAVFVFGWFLMGKLDCFLEENRRAQELRLSSGGNTLRLGFCNPTAADSITDVLERYSGLYPNTSVHVFCGSGKELLKGLLACEFDVIFLPENAEVPDSIHCDSRLVSLNDTPVMMKYGGLPIEPITDGRISQRMLWNGKKASSFAACFGEYPEEEFAVSERAK